MKKLLFVAVLGVFAACGSNHSETPAAVDSTKVDSSKVDTAHAVVDTTKHADSAKVDTTAAKHK